MLHFFLHHHGSKFCKLSTYENLVLRRGARNTVQILWLYNQSGREKQHTEEIPYINSLTLSTRRWFASFTGDLVSLDCK